MALGTGMLLAFGAVKLSAVAAYAFRGRESRADIARKPPIVDELVESAKSRLDLQSAFTQSASYDDRLREVLSNTRAVALDFMIANKITVGLDQRLGQASEHAGFWDSDIHALYYPQDRVLTLYDTGDDYKSAGFWGSSASDYSARLLREFADYYETRDIGELSRVQAGESHMVDKLRVYRWHDDAADFALYRKNSELERPPLRV